ncbi:MAG: efflux RND transporter periplasmic adaptor subunit [Planctomycetes bacterium]|nr:efflux RND transporter periplasmic adaptor subunit [Planctomycetota bacterium]
MGLQRRDLPLWVLALGLTGCGGSALSSQPAGAAAVTSSTETTWVRVVAARRAPLAALYVTSATLRPERAATVTARTRGVVRELLVEEGDRVEADQPLVRLEDDDQQIERRRALAVRAQEETELQRAQQLRAQKALSENELDTARKEYDEACHRLEVAELALKRTTIRAPFAGRVLRRHLDAGAMVSDGTAVLDLANVEPLEADLSVPERHVARLAVGQGVRVSVDATGDLLPARISRIAPSVDAASGTVRVTISVHAPGVALRPGAFVRAAVVTETRPEALVVPRAALVAQGPRWFLFRRAGDRAERLEVEVGLEEGDLVEVARGLEEGDEVVVTGAAALSHGARVEVLD